MNELEQDAHFPFYVGRLIGAAEMTSWWLRLQAGPETQEMGRRLGTVVSWFLTDEIEAINPHELSARATTEIRPPSAGNL